MHTRTVNYCLCLYVKATPEIVEPQYDLCTELYAQATWTPGALLAFVLNKYRPYIGCTTRALHTRVREHASAIKRKDNTSALSEHYQHEHGTTTEPKLKVDIVDRARDELHLKIKEAYHIDQLKPSLNRKKEDMGIGFLV